MGYREDREGESLRDQVEAVGFVVPFRETLGRLLRNPHILRAVGNPEPMGETLEDEADGDKTRLHSLVREHPDCLRIRLYYDDVELCELGSSHSFKAGEVHPSNPPVIMPLRGPFFFRVIPWEPGSALGTQDARTLFFSLSSCAALPHTN
jgi:hypothetical protein